MSGQPVTVGCRPQADGWRCEVIVGDDAGATEHEVIVDREALRQLAPAGATPEELVRASFEFLLEREPRTSIMRRFELPLIGRFFPDYEAALGRRMGRRQ